MVIIYINAFYSIHDAAKNERFVLFFNFGEINTIYLGSILSVHHKFI